LNRYSRFHGKHAVNPLTGDVIPIIFDDNVDPTFETGAVKVTASHDFNDYEIAQRHGIKDYKVILSDNGHLINVPDEYMVIFQFSI
jgi:valyl-tRNA synthetase